MEKLNKNKTGFVFGLFIGGFHAIWAALVAIGIAKKLLDFILSLHFFEVTYEIAPFAIGKALLLILITFVCGYVAGWILAAICNMLRKA
ncbi:hypothetical protein A2336_01645 [Candidatus Peregrinibacteria bacterium RIFOXYB2_FULL_41_88]|nr:MAG: hypothetical protein A2336_01645 [Candidatus Peregrinibacteria bacterium RIFOXYB2_FULL_41_88]